MKPPDLLVCQTAGLDFWIQLGLVEDLVCHPVANPRREGLRMRRYPVSKEDCKDGLEGLVKLLNLLV